MNEATFMFGPGHDLVGTVATPATSMHDYGAVLFNAGVIPRIGPNRLNVRIARALAQQGIPVLRFDLSGRGDSAPARGMASFEEQAVADLRAAMDAMSERTAARRFLLMGICSGAECAYHAALADERVVAISLMDSYHYPTWRTHLNRYLSRARRQGGVWKAAAGWLARRVRRGVASSPVQRSDASASFGSIRPTAAQFAANLHRLLDRGVDIDLLYSGTFVETYNYANQFRDVFGRYGLPGRLREEFRPDLDHTISCADMQRSVIARTCAWATAVTARPDARPCQ